MGCLSCIAYFSHDSYNIMIADIITRLSTLSLHICISMRQRMLFVASVHGIAVVGMYMAFYSCLKELKLEQ